jgi:hypothetical protein
LGSGESVGNYSKRLLLDGSTADCDKRMVKAVFWNAAIRGHCDLFRKQNRRRVLDDVDCFPE